MTDIKPVWMGDGTPVDMWLLQMDLAGHSKWTAKLNSPHDAYVHRREFANRITEALKNKGFCRLAWGGDGGVYVAHSSMPIAVVIEAGEAVHTVFRRWFPSAPSGEDLKVRVSIHRARITTADDPGFCFGTGLNDFMKFERNLADSKVDDSLVVSEDVYVDLPLARRQHWIVLERNDSSPLGTLRAAYSRRHDQLQDARMESALTWLEGAWHNEESDSAAYCRIVNGLLKFVYCYRGDSEHTASYSLSLAGEDVVGTFSWRKSPISGYVNLRPDGNKNRLSGGWWYASDVPSGVQPKQGFKGMIKSNWTRVAGKSYPKWAEEALR